MRQRNNRQTIADLCHFINGNGFKPSDWKTSGLPIIRIQNLNGVTSFNHYDGPAKSDWIVDNGDLLYAWAGVKGVSFGPTIWQGPKGVLNQHIYKVVPHADVDRYWLFLALKHVTTKIESQAHGFKSSLVHVHKEDITGQVIEVPLMEEQKKIAAVMRAWEEAIDKLDSLTYKLEELNTALRQKSFEKQFSCEKGHLKASRIFEPVSERARPDLPLLAVMQDLGVVRRDELDRRVAMPDGDISSYKVVRPGDFVISLRSFEGGLEYSNVLGLVSPAYTVLRPNRQINSDYYRHFFKSRSFIGRLDKLIFGIRDGKQIAFRDFGDMRIPNPSIKVQESDAAALNQVASLLELNQKRKQSLEKQKRGLMQKLLTGQWRVKA